MHVHSVLEKSSVSRSAPLSERYKSNCLWTPEVDTIRADADQLSNVSEFFYYAMDAMRRGGN